MQRRDLMTMTGAALLLAGGRALAQSANAQASTEAKVVRIYATPDGGSRVEELTISPDAKPIESPIHDVGRSVRCSRPSV